MTAATDGLGPDHLPAWYQAACPAFPLGWKPGLGTLEWRRKGIEAWLPLLVEPPLPQPGPGRILASEDRGSHTVHLMELELYPGRPTRVLMAVPGGTGPFPAVLALHDHGAYFACGKEKMIRPLVGSPLEHSACNWAERNYGGVFPGDHLASRGYLVLAADALGWGDRACPSYEGQQAVASNLFNLGSSWAGLIAVEDLAAADYLAHHPLVDPARVIALGHSMGGFRASQATSLSPHVTAGVAACFLGTIRGLLCPGGNRTRGQSAFAMTHPGLSRLMDFPDMTALAAPKPLYLLHGTEDHLTPLPELGTALDHIAEVYGAFGASSALCSVLRPGGHHFGREDQDAAIAWLASTW